MKGLLAPAGVLLLVLGLPSLMAGIWMQLPAEEDARYEWKRLPPDRDWMELRARAAKANAAAGSGRNAPQKPHGSP